MTQLRVDANLDLSLLKECPFCKDEGASWTEWTLSVVGRMYVDNGAVKEGTTPSYFASCTKCGHVIDIKEVDIWASKQEEAEVEKQLQEFLKLMKE